MVQVLEQVFTRWGFVINGPKCHVIHINAPAAQPPVHFANGTALTVQSPIEYLGYMIGSDGRPTADYGSRLKKAEAVFYKLTPTLFDRTLRQKTRGAMFKCSVMTIMLHGSECWALSRKDTNVCAKLYHTLVRMMAGVRSLDHEPLSHTFETHGLHTLQAELRSRRLQWLGHLARLEPHRLPKIAYQGWPAQDPHPLHQPHRGPRPTTWRQLTITDLKAIGGTLATLETLAQDRGAWLKKRKALFERPSPETRTCFRCQYKFEHAARMEKHLQKSTRCAEQTLRKAVKAGQAQGGCPIQ
jgi:hypothetical protein